MSLKGSLTLKNADDLIRRMAALNDESLKKIMSDALREAAKPMKSAIRSMAPRNTGLLASSVRIGRVTKGRGDGAGHRSLKIDVMAGKGKGMFVGDTYYAGFLEYGTDMRFHKGGKSVGRVAARGFMQQAFDATQSEASQIFEAMLNDGIDRAMKT